MRTPLGGILPAGVAGAAVAVALAGTAQAGWHAPQKLDTARSYDDVLALATSPSGHAVAVWESRRNRLRVAVARAGRPFSRSRAIPSSAQDGFDVRVAVAPNGRAIVAFEYHDGSFFDPTDLRGDGCCRGTKVAMVSPSGAVTAARAVRPRGTISPLAGIAAGASRFGVLIGGTFNSGLRFAPISSGGRAGSPRSITPARSAYDGASLQLDGRRAVASLLSVIPARVAVSAQGPGGAFSKPKVVVRVPEKPFEGFLPRLAVAPAGRGRNVVAYTDSSRRVSRVRLTRFDAAGHATTLARPSQPGANIQLTAPAVAGGAVAVAYGHGRNLRLITRSATGRVRRRTLASIGTSAGSPTTALGGGGAIAISTTPTSPRRAFAPRVFFLPSAGGRVAQVGLPRSSSGSHPVAVDRRGRVRVLYRDPDRRPKARLRTR